MKKTLILLICLSFVLSLLLCSCDKKKDKKTTTTTTAQSTTPRPGPNPGSSSSSSTSTQPVKTYPNFGGSSLVIQLSDYSDAEFNAGGKKYMAGPDGPSSDKVENYVYERNQEAYAKLGVEVEYRYSNKGWAQMANEIKTTESTGSDCPDMYSEMLYDMMIATMNSCFYNLKNMTVESGNGHFEFTEENGYMTEFMEGLTMSNDKMYLLGSQYFVDLIRSMMVLSVNIDLYQQTCGDIIDFYDDIMRGKWTWDYMIGLGKMHNDRTGDGSTMDDILVFAAETAGGRSASGLVYSTDIHILETRVEDDGSYTFSYNPNNPQLYSIFNKIAQVFAANGFCAITGGTAQSETDELFYKFASGTILFGGAINMGAVEKEVYQNMTQSFGLVPIPKMSEADSYNTLIHNVGRCGAISYHCTKLKEISAFIQFCSENSDDVVNEYYNYAMKYKYTSDAGTAEMLDMIYDNIVAIREKAMDDLIGAMNTEAGSLKWHSLLMGGESEDYQSNAGQIATVYTEAIMLKKNVLDTLKKTWATLP